MKISNENISIYQASENINIRETVKLLDQTGIGFIAVVNKDSKVVGILTDGDFRRAILKGVNLDNNILEIVNRNFVFVEDVSATKEIINLFLLKKVYKIPVIKEGRLVDILFRESYSLEGKYILNYEKKNVSVVVMAGGKGTRMKPFTNILPKPLIPIGEQSILEVIMDRYQLFFDVNFKISVNYKANMIKAYLEEFKDKYQISYIDEDQPLGTGGALTFLEGKITEPFFVSNCDIIINADYQSIYESHIDKQYDITVVASMLHYKIPYGVCKINEGGELKQMVEKPEYDYLVNAGMYIINPDVLKYIPENEFYNITDLINKVKENGGKVGVFPVSEKSYLDAGQWKEYGDMLNALK